MTTWLLPAARAALDAEAARAFPRETGGALMGYWNGDDVVITDAVGPGPRATHARTGFCADDAFQTAEVARIYATSGRCNTYLGDWHTHPLGPAALSALDVATLRKIATAPEARIPRATSLLLAGSPERWEIAAWSWQGRPVRMTIAPAAAEAA